MKTTFPTYTTRNSSKSTKNSQVPSFPSPPLFITNLDPTVTQESLYTFFIQFGPLQFVVITEDSQTANSSRCAYVKFFNYFDAEKACIQAQYQRLGEKHIKLRFQRDIRDFLFETTLLIRNLPPTAAIWDVLEHFGQTGIEVTGVNIDKSLEGLAFGCGYVQFERKEDAEVAFNDFQGKELMGNKLELISFFPKDFIKRTNMKASVRINRLPEDRSAEELKRILTETLSIYGEIKSIAIEKEAEGEGYSGIVYFKDDEDAQAAYNDLTENVREYSGSKRQVLVVREERENREKPQEDQKDSENGKAQFSDTDDDEDPFYVVKAKNKGPAKSNTRGWGVGNGQAEKKKEKKSQQKILYVPKGKYKISGQNGTNISNENNNRNKEENKPRPLILHMRAEKEEEILWIADSYIEVPLDQFLKLNKDKQKEKLAKLLFPRVRAVTEDKYAPRVTGMLADLSKHKVIDIIEFIHDPELLKERIDEAIEQIEGERER